MDTTIRFRIHMPYGITETEEGEIIAFNREYLPLGVSSNKDKKAEIFTKYRFSNKICIKDELLISQNNIQVSSKNETTYFLYNDLTNPFNFKAKKMEELYRIYLDKINKIEKNGIYFNIQPID